MRITSCVSHNSEESERKKALFNSVDNRLKSVKFAKMLVVDGNVLRVQAYACASLCHYYYYYYYCTLFPNELFYGHFYTCNIIYMYLCGRHCYAFLYGFFIFTFQIHSMKMASVLIYSYTLVRSLACSHARTHAHINKSTKACHHP